MAKLKVGTKVDGRYTLKELKGSGSFGEVWLAHDELLDGDVAVKIYIPLDNLGVEEFKNEYKTTLGLYHTNLLKTDYFDVWEQHPYLVMKYCARGSASVQIGKMDEYMLWQFIHDVAAGLKYLHSLSEPIVHQDIKPDNILISDDGKYLITDFGISKRVRSTMRKQSKRAVGAGATAYMAPERFDSDPTPIKASDVWSLGVSIYELATGELPFSGLGGGMQKNGADSPVLDKKWSKDMNMVMQSCLAKDAWDRPTAQQLEEYSEAIIKGKPAKVIWSYSGTGRPTPPSSSGHEEGDGEGGGEMSSISDFGKPKYTSLIIVSGIIVCVLICLCVSISRCSSSGDTVDPPVIPELSDTLKTDDGNKNDSVENTTKMPQPTEPDNSSETQTKEPQPPKGGDVAVQKTSDDEATALKNALKNEDYETVKELASQGYAPAYGPLAKYYYRINKFDDAENYAKKAKKAGRSDGDTVLILLKANGYYDDKDNGDLQNIEGL